MYVWIKCSLRKVHTPLCVIVCSKIVLHVCFHQEVLATSFWSTEYYQTTTKPWVLSGIVIMVQLWSTSSLICKVPIYYFQLACCYRGLLVHIFCSLYIVKIVLEKNNIKKEKMFVWTNLYYVSMFIQSGPLNMIN